MCRAPIAITTSLPAYVQQGPSMHTHQVFSNESELPVIFAVTSLTRINVTNVQTPIRGGH